MGASEACLGLACAIYVIPKRLVDPLALTRVVSCQSIWRQHLVAMERSRPRSSFTVYPAVDTGELETCKRSSENRKGHA